MIVAKATQAAQVMFWVRFAVLVIRNQFWRLWMQSSRTADWLRMMQAEEEKKRKRDGWFKSVLGEVTLFVKILLRK